MGWYPDPTNPDEERYWDGERWTRNTRETLDRPAWSSGLGARAAQAPEVEPEPVPMARQWDHVAMEWRDLPVIDPVRRTADGVPLASFWRRLLGRVVDDLLVGLVVVAICFPQVRSVWQRLTDYLRMAATDPSSSTDFYVAIQGDATLIALVSIILTATTAAFFHHRFGATPGQMLVRVRVVPLGDGSHTGGLPLSTSLRRAVAVALILGIPVALGVYQVMGVGRFFDALMALIGPTGQTMHDRAGRTQVVDATAAEQHTPPREQQRQTPRR